MNLKIVRDLQSEAWHHFVQTHPESNIFHTPEMFQVFKRAKNYHPELWAAIDDDDHVLVLFLPVQINLSNVLRSWTTRAVLYGSVLCAPGEPGRQALALLLQTYRQAQQGHILFTELRNLVDTSNMLSTFQAHGFVYEEHLNYLIDLARPADQIFQNIGKRTRTRIRKALREGVIEISEITSLSDLEDWYTVLQQTYHRARVPLTDRSLFQAALDLLHARGMATFWVARIDGHIAACSVELGYKDTLYGWYGGLNREYGQYDPNELLTWHILDWGARKGFKIYDFGGAGKPDEEYGVRDFKAKFGGQLVSFGRYRCVHAPNKLAVSQFLYSGYQRVMRK